jgi:Na+-transporting NADH:ubiquinone oxidoreductase subunit NqrD
MKKIILINFLIIFVSGISAQSIEEKNKEMAIKYINAYMEADINTLVILLDKAYKHYLFDVSKEDYEGLLNLVKKR